MAYCPKCGKEIADDSNFCPACGFKIGEAVTPAVTVSAPAPVAENKQVALPENVSPKSRLCALLLGIFLGEIGVHNFYLGRVGRGITQLLMFVSGFAFYIFGIVKISFNATYNAAISRSFNYSEIFTSVPFILIGVLLFSAASIWSLVEWIMIACGKSRDKQGRPVLVWTR